MKFEVGWAEKMGTALASKDEQVRAAAIGLPPRRCFRRNEGRVMDSAAKGGHLGALSKARKRKFAIGSLD